MAFDNIKLDKGLYSTTKGFTASLEEIDPSENYIGTELEGLDPTLRKKVIDTVDDIVCHTGSALILVTHESGEAVALGCEQIALKPKRRDVNRWH